MEPFKLPQELEDEILVRTLPTSLSRFKTVCKRWNTLISDKRFAVANNKFHSAFARPEFMIDTLFKTYSVSINLEDDNDPKVVQRELTTLDNPMHFEGYAHLILNECNGFLLCGTNGRAAVINPLLKQTRWIEPAAKPFYFCGLGYDSRMPENSYKVVGYAYDSITYVPSLMPIPM